MFGKKEPQNPYAPMMEANMQNAFKGGSRNRPCSDQIKPMIQAFFKKAQSIEAEKRALWHIENVTEVAVYVALNTRNYHKLRNDEVASLKKIFQELESIFVEAINFDYTQGDDKDLINKVMCIKEVLNKNMIGMHDDEQSDEGEKPSKAGENPRKAREKPSKAGIDNYRDGMIFREYETLWKVIHRINTEWKDLCSRNFTMQVFLDFWGSIKYDRTNNCEKDEAGKLSDFMAILDGKKKFIPVIEQTPVGFKIADIHAEDQIIKRIENQYSTAYKMSKKK